MAKFCTRCGSPIGQCACGQQESDILGVFPRDIQPCDGEEKVKAYHCSSLRSKFTGRSLAEGVLTITNKRVIYRTVCYSNDKNFAHSEMPIEGVSGVSLHKGRYFDFIVFFFNYFLIDLILVAPAYLFGKAIDQDGWMVLVWVLVWAVALIGLFAAFQALRGNLQRIVAANGSLLRYVLDAAKYILWPMKNPLVLTIASKGGSQGPIHIKLPKRIGQIDISADVAPLPDTAAITREIGTIINDIQKAGFSAAAGSPPAPVRQAPQYPAQQAWYAGGYQQPDPYYPQAQPYGQANGGYQPYIA